MSPLYFNLLFILVFSTTCLAIQERAIESCGLFYEQYSQKLKMAAEPDIMEDFKLAAKEGRIGELKCLIANLTSVDSYGQRTALWHAAKAGHPEVVRYLLHGGAAINPRRDYRETNNSGTPLYVSVENGHFPIVMYLIEQGANVNLFHDEKAPLTVASGKGEYDMVVYLVQNGANFLYSTGHVHEAAANGHLKIVRYFHRLGADIEARDTEDRRPLWLAAQNGHLEVVEYLVRQLAVNSVNMVDGSGKTAMAVAAEEGHVEIVKLLENHRADVKRPSSNGETPLLLAARNGHFEVVKFLYERGVSIDAASSNRTTPLWEAASNGHIRIVQFLVEKGADVNAFDAQGNTPLYIALSRVWREVANYLLQKGATGACLQNPKGSSAVPVGDFSWMVSIGHWQHQAKTNIRTWRHMCSGTIISRKHVLTASSCWMNQYGVETHILAGVSNLNRREHLQLHRILKAHFMPASEGRRALPIAILEVDLYRSLVLDTFVTTACLPQYVPNNDSNETTGDISDGYKINVAAGWGSIDSRLSAHPDGFEDGRQRFSYLDVKSAPYSWSNEEMLCAKCEPPASSANPRPTCSADIGSPVMELNDFGDIGEQFLQTGIVVGPSGDWDCGPKDTSLAVVGLRTSAVLEFANCVMRGKRILVNSDKIC